MLTGARTSSLTCSQFSELDVEGQLGLAAPQGLLLVSFLVPVVDTGGRCRSVRRRHERLARWRAWHASGIRAINELCSGRAIPSRRDPSRGQAKIWSAYVNVGRPPDDLTVAGAFGELCGLRVDYHDDECGLRVPFQPGLAAQPRVGSKPIDTVSCLLPEARGLADTWRQSPFNS